MERPVRGDTHAGCGGRTGETHREQSRQSAPVRPNPTPLIVRPFEGDGVRVTVGTPEENDRFLAVAGQLLPS